MLARRELNESMHKLDLHAQHLNNMSVAEPCQCHHLFTGSTQDREGEGGQAGSGGGVVQLYQGDRPVLDDEALRRVDLSTLPTLVELGEFLSENLGLQVEPGLRRRQVGSAWATNIVNALQTFFKARDASAPPKPCSWCKSYCITACEACGLSNAHLICAMHAHVFIAELKKRLCRICAQAGVRAAIVNMSVKEKKNVLAEMGVMSCHTKKYEQV
ncbi:hypothetical protein AB1Y20_008038 [Prymnesium parvum]|uniref:PHD-type domain-containing protein n=1 Tax=Prymnesium parvum TaxID=97485 RepID=A0AB34IVI3_PRYPA